MSKFLKLIGENFPDPDFNSKLDDKMLLINTIKQSLFDAGFLLMNRKGLGPVKIKTPSGFKFTLLTKDIKDIPKEDNEEDVSSNVIKQLKGIEDPSIDKAVEEREKAEKRALPKIKRQLPGFEEITQKLNNL